MDIQEPNTPYLIPKYPELAEYASSVHASINADNPALATIKIDDCPSWFASVTREDGQNGFEVPTKDLREWLKGLPLVLAVGDSVILGDDEIDAIDTYCDTIKDPRDFDEMCNLIVMAEQGELKYVPYGFSGGTPMERFGKHMAEVNGLWDDLSGLKNGGAIAQHMDYAEYAKDYSYDVGLGENGYIDMVGNYPLLDEHDHDEFLEIAGIETPDDPER